MQGPHQPGQPFKFTVNESCDRIKEEFSFIQAQYHRYDPLNHAGSFGTALRHHLGGGIHCTQSQTL